MIRPEVIPIWKKAPCSRMLLPLIAGILLQWYLQFPVSVIITALISFSISFLLFKGWPLAWRFKFQALQGLIIQLLFGSLGLLLTWKKDIRHDSNWYGNYYKSGSYLQVRIDEPLVEKTRSFKADGYVEMLMQNGEIIPGKGKLLLYFSKDSLKTDPGVAGLNYGDRIIIHKDLQTVQNSGNPGAFNYRRHAAFQGIFHQVFLKQTDWTIIKNNKALSNTDLKKYIFSARAYILSVLQNTIHTGRDELGIAGALLIGYTNDLDKELVQAYSNTGVVHIIAVSGMHLALIYVLLVWLLAKIPLMNRSKWLQLFLILACLWLFSILTGASPSVLRAAVMFSCIAIGKNLKKQVSIYSSLAASAFLLLCYDPYYLWSVGFQLSYLAVLGIVIFQKPLYHCIYIKNKGLDTVWQLMSVSTAAQLLAFPVCIYYFHQFPNLFLISNILVVPLSAFILYAAIALVAFSWIPLIGLYLGKLVGGSTWLMNTFILWVNDLSFAVWDKIPASVLSTWLLYAIVFGFGTWLIHENKKKLRLGLAALLAFVMVATCNSWQNGKQQKLVVYHVPQHQAIDFISGFRYQFVGDRLLQEPGPLQNFHLNPARIAQQLNSGTDTLDGVFHRDMFYQFRNKKIMLISSSVTFEPVHKRTGLDLIVISKNPKLSIRQLAGIFNCRLFVFDASNPSWKIEQWKQECRSLQVNFYSVAEEGAFIYNIGS